MMPEQDDYAYLMDYPVTVDNAEEWTYALSQVITGCTPDGWYSGQHRAEES